MMTWVPRIGYAYIRLLGATVRFDYRNRRVLDRIRGEGGRYVLAFWHSRFVLMPYAYPGPKLAVLSSEHRDSKMLARILARFGLESAWGSSTSGGAKGLRQLLRFVRQGYDLGLTPDGPKGPPREVKTGIIVTAKLCGLPIVPVSCAARPARRLGSWDRTLLPLPFGRAVFLYGEPLRVPRDADDEAVERSRAALEAELDRLTDEADRILGRSVDAPR